MLRKPSTSSGEGDRSKNISKRVETIVSGAAGVLAGRENGVIVHLDPEHLKRVDDMVKARVFPDRSESVAFLVGEGIKASATLFEKIEEGFEKIRQAEQELQALRSDSPALPDQSEQ